MTSLEDADELTLMTAWLKRVRAQADLELTRLGRVEVRHVCLYAKQQLEEIRTQVLRDDCNSGHVILELREIIAKLESLIGYLQTGRGGFSALGDRNTA
jgi:hypothetical protein